MYVCCACTGIRYMCSCFTPFCWSQEAPKGEETHLITKTMYSGNLSSSRKCLECGQLNSKMAKKCLQCRSPLQVGYSRNNARVHVPTVYCTHVYIYIYMCNMCMHMYFFPKPDVHMYIYIDMLVQCTFLCKFSIV